MSKARDLADFVSANSTLDNLQTTYVDTAGDTMTGLLTLSGGPTATLHAATKQYVDTIASAGIHYHDPVRVESPVNLNATYDNGTAGVGATLTNAGTLAAITIDGVALVQDDRVLVYAQTDATNNGIYTVTTVGDGSTAWVLTRATDADAYGTSDPASLGEGDAFFVKEGDTGAGELYVMNTEGTITFGTTNITFSVIAETAVYSAGTGMTLDGTTFSTAVYSAGTGMSLDGTTFSIDSTVVVDSDIGSTVQAYDANLQGFVDTFTLPTTDGTTDQVLGTNGSGVLSFISAGSTVDYQEFTSSGTWTKPSGVNFVYIEAVGGGGSGAVFYGSTSGLYSTGGGNGGCFGFRLYEASSLGATESVVIGSGGAARSGTNNGSGNAGGDTSFAGAVVSKGSQGGKVMYLSAATSAGDGGANAFAAVGAGGGAGGGIWGRSYDVGGGYSSGGGGGGGSAGWGYQGAGGTSFSGGNGGAAKWGSGTADSGTAPGGGGGGMHATSSLAGTSGAGASGRIRIWAW